PFPRRRRRHEMPLPCWAGPSWIPWNSWHESYAMNHNAVIRRAAWPHGPRRLYDSVMTAAGHADPAQSHKMQSRTAESRTAPARGDVDPAHSKKMQSRTAQSRTAQSRTAQSRTAQSRTAQSRTAQSRSVDQPPIRWGIMATGSIASKFADDLQLLPDHQVAA